MGMYTSSCGDRQVFVVKQVTLFPVDLCVRTPVDELKGNCGCYVEKEQINGGGGGGGRGHNLT